MSDQAIEHPVFTKLVGRSDDGEDYERVNLLGSIEWAWPRWQVDDPRWRTATALFQTMEDDEVREGVTEADVAWAKAMQEAVDAIDDSRREVCELAPLHRVIEHTEALVKTPRHLDVVRILLENGADVHARGSWCGVTAIALAAMGHEAEFLPLLMPYLDRYDIFTAAILGQARQVATLLKRDPTKATTPDINNLTPLHYVAASRLGTQDSAVDEQLKRIAELLIDAGADVNAPARIGQYSALPPIHFAAGNKSILQTLLRHGADPAAALSAVLWNGDYQIAETLIRAGASLKTAQAGEWVSDFSRWGHTPQAKWLIERGADVNGRTSDGRTALHWAVQRGASADLVRFLFDQGADVTLHDAEGNTALQLAFAKKRTRLIPLLQNLGTSR